MVKSKEKQQKNTGIDRKAWIVVFGVLVGVVAIFMVSSNLVGDSNITGYASDNPFGITGDAVFNNSINGSLYIIFGVFAIGILFYLVRRIAKNY